MAILNIHQLPDFPEVVIRTTKLNLFHDHMSINQSKNFIRKDISRFTKIQLDYCILISNLVTNLIHWSPSSSTYISKVA